MAAILYVETNLLMAIAKGQDPDADALLASPPDGVRLAIPSVCIMESFSALNELKKHQERFLDAIGNQLNEAGRDSSDRTKQLVKSLEQSRITSERWFNHVLNRLYGALDRIRLIAEGIDLSSSMLEEALTSDYIDDATDNLILECILGHARTHPEPKAFLSGNSKDFGKAEVQGPLRAAGIRYMKWTKDALGWISALPRGAPP